MSCNLGFDFSLLSVSLPLFCPYSIGVDLAGILRGTHGERRRWVDAKWGWGMVRDVPSPADSLVGWRGDTPQVGGTGLGSVVSSPAGSGAEPRPKTDFGIF